MSPNITIVTFGTLSIAGLSTQLGSRRAVALFIYLSIANRELVRRETLIDLLWGTKQLKRARHSLSQTVYDLRSVLPPGSIITTPERVGLSQGVIRVDYLDFKQALDDGNLQRATELYKGRFLDDFQYITDTFDDWRTQVSARAHADANAAFQLLVSEALDREDYEQSAAISKTALILDPLNARMVKTRIESLAAAGDVGRALQELELSRNQFRMESGRVPTELSDGFDATLARLSKGHPAIVPGTLHTKLIGRTAELRIVRDHWRAQLNGMRVVAIVGEPGIGKSRLLEHIVRRGVLDGSRAFVCRCTEAEKNLPYGAIANLIRSTCRREDLSRLHANWLTILATITPELLQATEPAHGCSQRALWEAITHFFLQISDHQSIVIGVDDLQWCDEVSKDALRYVTQRLAERRVMLIVASRGVPDVPVHGDDLFSVITLTLEKLDEDSTREMIRLVAAQQGVELTASTWSFLTQHIGGQPFFLLEALRQLAVDRTMQTARLEDFQLSPNLERHLEHRLRTVSTNGKRVLDAAAVLGRPASLHFLSRVTGLSPVQMTTTAAELVEQGILADVGEVRFSHDLLLEAQRRRLRLADSRLWHSRIAEVLAQSEQFRTGEIASHYEESGDQDHSQRYARIARDEALAVHAYVEADAQFQRLIRCASNAGRPEAEGEYVKWLARCARLKEVSDFPPSVAKHFTVTSDYEGQLAIALAEFQHLERRGTATAGDLKHAALRIVDFAQSHVPALLTTVLWQVADTIRRNGDFNFIARLAEMVRTQSAEAESEVAVDMLSLSAMLTAISVGHKNALPVAENAVRQALLIDDPMLLAKTLYARGTINLWAGLIRQADHDYRELSAIANPIGPHDLLERMESNSSVLLLEQGHLAKAEQRALDALHSTSRGRTGYIYGNLSLIALARNDPDSATKYARALLDWNAAQQHSWIPVNAEALLGLAELAQGDHNSAAARAEYVRSSLEQAHTIIDVSHAYVLISRIDEARGRSAQAAALLASVAHKVQRRDYLAGLRLRLERARLQSRDNPVGALRLVKAVARIAERRGAVTLAREANSMITA